MPSLGKEGGIGSAALNTSVIVTCIYLAPGKKEEGEERGRREGKGEREGGERKEGGGRREN